MKETMYNETVFAGEWLGFTAIPNKILKDERINLETIGLYVTMCDLANAGETKFTIEMLLRRSDDREVVERCLKALLEAGYIKIAKGGEYGVK